MKKLLVLLFIITITLSGLTACSNANQDTYNTIMIGDKLAANQPTPTDIQYSLERYNLIRRAYWVNGQREKAINLPSPVTLPLGYVVLFNANTIIAQFTVEGKVSSLTNYLTPISMYYERYSDGNNKWLADTDGTYGDNPTGIYFFTTDGKYVEWNGQFLYSDMPIFVEDPIVHIK
ncbi:MAG: hypothetical protein WBL80_03325 [Erysipelotrichaceae bacterium]